MRLRPAATPAAALVACLVLAGCGDKSRVDSTTTAATATTQAGPGPTVPRPQFTKPTVSIPAATPTDLVVTDLTEGAGRAAVEGDTVVVHYVGVLSADGTEFDDNYGESPFPVVLGAGSVIQGWDRGLVGVKQGGRRQLDIPADLGYGERGSGAVIKPGDALTFVVDVVAVVPRLEPVAAPVTSVAPTGNIATAQVEDLTIGDGATASAGWTAVVQIVAFRADTGEVVIDSFADGQKLDLELGMDKVLPGVENMVLGMKVGGIRRAQIPYAEAFGAQGNQQAGMPGAVDLIAVVKLITLY